MRLCLERYFSHCWWSWPDDGRIISGNVVSLNMHNNTLNCWQIDRRKGNWYYSRYPQWVVWSWLLAWYLPLKFSVLHYLITNQVFSVNFPRYLLTKFGIPTYLQFVMLQAVSYTILTKVRNNPNWPKTT